jgi:hypothetical protein
MLVPDINTTTALSVLDLPYQMIPFYRLFSGTTIVAVT